MDISLSNDIKISICIPTYEVGGRGVLLLNKLIKSIVSQTYTNFEIIISDQSLNNDIEDYITNLNLKNIKYFKYLDNLGSPTYNTNNAIEKSSGDYIKIMFMDDYFEDETVLDKMVCGLKSSEWVVCGFKHKNIDAEFLYNPLIPRIESDGKHLLRGLNYIGCPSVCLIPKNNFFDTEVKYMFDCELWYRLFVKYGMPEIINEHKIIVTTGNHSLTHQLSSKYDEMLKNDILYCKNKFNL
jgi:glycosyltransferase involved in cell wall biosynthesis